jgi:urease accessory protein
VVKDDRAGVVTRWLLSLVLAAWATPALAHVERGQAAGLLSGLSHPVSGLDHVLAMLAVGLWGAQFGSPALWLLPVAFPMTMAVGGVLGLVGLPLPGVEVGIAVSGIVLGAMVLSEARPPLPVALVLVGLFALFHGHAHGTELPAGQSGLTYSIGFVAATGCLHGVGIAIGLVHRWDWGRSFLRLAGGLIAAGGLYFLWRALS